jgi:hypothetical protein
MLCMALGLVGAQEGGPTDTGPIGDGVGEDGGVPVLGISNACASS